MPKKPQASSGSTFLITTENACWRQETKNWNTLGQQEETTSNDLFFNFFDIFFHVCVYMHVTVQIRVPEWPQVEVRGDTGWFPPSSPALFP